MLMNKQAHRAAQAKARVLSFFQNESAQATVEYMLMLACVVSFFIVTFRKILKPALEKLAISLSRSIDQRMSEGGLHRFPLPSK